VQGKMSLTPGKERFQRFYWFFIVLVVIVVSVVGYNLIRQQEPESFVKADVEAQARNHGVEIRNLSLKSSELGVGPAEEANGIERRAGVYVRFIYRCPKTQAWFDGFCRDDYLGAVAPQVQSDS
jgi:hypothetical protein